MKKAIITEHQQILIEDVNEYRGMLENARDLILSFDKDNINMAFEILNGLMPEIQTVIKGYHIESFIYDYFRSLADVLFDGGFISVWRFKELLKYGSFVPDTDHRYIIFEQNPVYTPSHILFDVEQNKAFGLNFAGYSSPRGVMFTAAAFIPDIATFYKNMYGVDVYVYRKAYFIRMGDIVYMLEGDDIYKIEKTDKGYKYNYSAQGKEPSVVLLILADLNDEIIDEYNGYEVSFEQDKGVFCVFTFYKPEFFVKYYEDFENDFVSILEYRDGKEIRYGEEFFKKFPDLTEYINKHKKP